MNFMMWTEETQAEEAAREGRLEVKQEPGEGEDDDDPVIHEIPVYLSKSIPKLYLFQVRIIELHLVAHGRPSLNNWRCKF